MGFFDKFKNKNAKWDEAYVSAPHFYSNDKVQPFGAFSLTEDTETILPLRPAYKVDDQPITEWKLILVSITKNGVLGEMDYHAALKALQPYVVDERSDSILLRRLTLDEMLQILG